MALLLTFLFLALFTSFLCSIMEAVLLSIPQTYLKATAAKGQSWAKRLSKMKLNIDGPLSAILSLNTIANTVGAAGVGAQSIKVFGEAYFGIASAVLTLLILYFSEIIPKTLGAVYYRPLAKPISLLIRVVMFITAPLVYTSKFITQIISSRKNEKSVSIEEISALLQMGTNEGILSKKQSIIIKNLLRLNEVRVDAIMTPRAIMATCRQDQTIEEFVLTSQIKFSRVPVYAKDNDDIEGYILRQDALEKFVQSSNEKESEKSKPLATIKREILVFPFAKTALMVWENMLKNRAHIALISNEYGDIDGLITHEDLMEALWGLEILDEKDRISNLREYARARWRQKDRYKSEAN